MMGMAVHLGRTTPLAAAAANTPQINFKNCIKLWIYHYIAGYSTSTIALLQFGSGNVIDTNATTSYSSIAYNVTTTAASVGATARTGAGIPVANDATANGRRGVHEVWNLPGEPTFCESRTETFNGNPTAASVAQNSLSVVCGNWWPTQEADCVRLNGNAGNLNIGSYIDVWGIPTAP